MGQGGATISGITDSGVDSDGDGAFEALAFTVTLEVAETGTYTVTVNMLPAGISEVDSQTVELAPGTHDVTLTIDGQVIKDSGVDGPYHVRISLIHQQTQVETRDHVTGTYTTGEFGAPGPGAGASSFEYKDGNVLVKYDIMQVDIDVTAPSLTFYYSVDGGEHARFSVEYTELLAYDDTDGDGVLGAGEDALASAKLADVKWDHVLYFMSVEDDVVLSAVELTGTVPLEFGDGDTGLVEMTFYYPTHHDEANTHSQRKFDITFTLPGALDADNLALRHQVSALSGDHSFREVGEGADFTRLEFIDDGSGDLHGFYEWTPDIELTGPSGTTSSSMLATAGSVEGDTVTLEFNYPVRDLEMVYHDPVVGLNPDIDFGGLGAQLNKVLHNPAVFFVTVLVAAALVMFSLARRRK